MRKLEPAALHAAAKKLHQIVGPICGQGPAGAAEQVVAAYLDEASDDDVRDRLAGAALPAIIAEVWKAGSPLDGVLKGSTQHVMIAISAYEIADVMMRVRKAKNGEERAAMIGEMAPELIEAIKAGL